MALGPKRKVIEKKLGRPLQVYLRGRLLANATQAELAQELGLDPTTVGYYVRKWELPYDRKGARRRTRSKWGHLEICVCVLCKHKLCRDSRESHYRGRCVMWCLEFLGRHQKLSTSAKIV